MPILYFNVYFLAIGSDIENIKCLFCIILRYTSSLCRIFCTPRRGLRPDLTSRDAWAGGIRNHLKIAKSSKY